MVIRFYNLFSTPSSLNLVGFHLLLHSLSTWFYSLPHFSPLFRLSVTHLSHAVVVTSPSCFLVGDWCCRIHWTVLPMLYYILFSSTVFSHFTIIVRICITILMPRHSCWVDGNYFLFWWSFDGFVVGYPVMGFVVFEIINCNFWQGV